MEFNELVNSTSNSLNNWPANLEQVRFLRSSPQDYQLFWQFVVVPDAANVAVQDMMRNVMSRVDQTQSGRTKGTFCLPWSTCPNIFQVQFLPSCSSK